MSSFKRRTPSRQATVPSGARACPISTPTVLTSSGIPSLDDILGGGVPLSCSIAVLAPDSHSAYGELIQKYFVAQGIASGHKVCIINEDALSFAKECMWMPASRPARMDDDDDAVRGGEKIKIAWRYEHMEKFETTVTDSLSADDFCAAFDLSCRIPVSVIDEAHAARRLVPLDLADPEWSMNICMGQIAHVLATTPSTEVVRISITALGSPDWGEHCSPTSILRFLYALRRVLRRYPHGCACVSVAPHICTEVWAGSGWAQKIGWLTDGTISMSSFGADPALTMVFPSHHGLVKIHKLPVPHSIQPASDRRSSLRGLSSTAAASNGGGENNLGFRCTRKRLIFETVHLGFEGGVTERRTTPLDAGIHTHVSEGAAKVAVEVEGRPQSGSAIAKKGKKKVGFYTERAEVYYDF